MKTNLLPLLFALFLPLISVAQPVQGSKEISLQGFVSNQEYQAKVSAGGQSDSGSDDMTAGSLFMRVGFFVSDNISIDPELTWGFSDQAAPAFAFSLNGSFQAPVNEKLFVYVTGGAGISNAIPFANIIIGRATEKFDISMYNFGGGLKYYLTEQVALRTEFRYQVYKYEREESYYFGKAKYEYTQKNNNLLIGFSFLL